MGQFVGADPDQLDVLGQHMGAAAERLESIRQQIGFWLDSSPWDGSDAEEFRSDWHHRLRNLLHAAATVARDGAASVARNAQQQRIASDMAGSGHAIGSGGGGWAGLFGGAVTAIGGGLGTLFDRYGEADFLTELAGYHWKYLAALRAAGSDVADMGLRDLLATGRDGVVNALGEYVQGIDGVGSAAKGLDAGAMLSGLGKVLPVASMAFDVGTAAAVFWPGSGASTAEKVTAGGDVAFDAAAIVTAEVPPVSLAIDGAHIGFDIYMDHRQEINDAVRTAVVEPAMDLVKLDVKLDVGAAQAVGSVVSGGVHALRGLL